MVTYIIYSEDLKNGETIIDEVCSSFSLYSILLFSLKEIEGRKVIKIDRKYSD